MLKLRARSRSFGSKDDTKSQKVTRGEFRQESSSSSICGSADDINIKPSSSNNNTSTRVEFPLELARSLQAFATSLSPQASTSRSVLKDKSEHITGQQALLPSSTLPIAPLKPILRSSTTSSVTAEGKQDSRAGRTASTTHHRQNSSVSSTASSKQITFLLPESPTSRSSLSAATSSAAGPGSRYAATAAAARGHCRQSSESSSTSSKKRVSITSTASSSNLKTQQKLQKVPASLIPGPVPASKTAPLPQEDIIHIQRTSSIMHARKSSDTPEVRRSSIDSLSKELPPLPLNASAPASSSASSRTSSRQSGHARGGSASSAASSVLSNPIHLPRLKLGDSSLGFPTNLLSPSPECSPATRSPLDERRFNWMGMGRKRDSGDSKRSSRRRSDTSVAGNIHSLPMNKHQRSRSSQLDVVHETDATDFKHAMPTHAEEANTRPALERNMTAGSRDEAARMTQIWVSLLEDFVLLCDDPTVPASNRSSASSLSSAFVAPPSPRSTMSSTSALLFPPVTSDVPFPISPSPSSECDPFLRLPRSARKKFVPPTKPLPPSPMPSLDVDDSAGSTTYTQSPSTPAESSSPNLPTRASFNPFEASFSSAELDFTSSTEEALPSTSYARRASLPSDLASGNSAYGAGRPSKQRPPPLQLFSISDSDDTIHTAVPPQTEAQTQFYTSQRSRSLPTQQLEPGSYRQPISPSKRNTEAEQLGASTSSNGSNRASRRYHFPSSTVYGVSDLKSSTTSTRRNKSIDEGYSGTGLTPTPTSDTFSIPSRSRETSVSSTSADSRRRSSCNTADTSLPSPTSASSLYMSRTSSSDGKRTPDNKLSRSQGSSRSRSNSSNTSNSEHRSNQSTPIANRRLEQGRTRSTRSQSASEHTRKKSTEATPIKRSPTLEIVMYGVAL